jgi:hypothetical protein
LKAEQVEEIIAVSDSVREGSQEELGKEAVAL